LKLLKFFLLGPPPSPQLFLKLMEKAHLFALNVQAQQKYPYFNLLQAVAYHYRQHPDVSHLQQIIDEHIKPSLEQGEANVNRLSEEELKT
jgi:hypothetical protein